MLCLSLRLKTQLKAFVMQNVQDGWSLMTSSTLDNLIEQKPDKVILWCWGPTSKTISSVQLWDIERPTADPTFLERLSKTSQSARLEPFLKIMGIDKPPRSNRVGFLQCCPNPGFKLISESSCDSYSNKSCQLQWGQPVTSNDGSSRAGSRGRSDFTGIGTFDPAREHG